VLAGVVLILAGGFGILLIASGVVVIAFRMAISER